MNHRHSLDAADRYEAGVLRSAAAKLGTATLNATSVIADPDRTGSDMVVIYPLEHHTLIWCSPDHAPGLASLGADTPIGDRAAIDALRRRGGEVIGAGNHRVLRAAPTVAGAGDHHRITPLDPTEARALALLQAFIDDCDADELDEAELDMDELDDTIVAALDETGAIAALSSVRPWSIDPTFDDIAVITHPHHRRRGLAAGTVAAISAQQQSAGRLLFYGCDVNNVGSNHVAESVGFALVATVTAVSVR